MGLIAKEFTESLQEAGYDLTDESSMQKGILAYNSALTVVNACRAAGDPNHKIRRNSPCPCGSGKKYKKCCLGKDGVDVPATPSHLEGSGVDPRIIPNLHDDTQMVPDLDRLLELISSEPALADLRYQGPEVMQHVNEVIQKRGLGQGELTNEVLDDIAVHYIKDHDGKKRISVASDLFTQLAPALATNPNDLRVLVLGVVLSSIEEVTNEPNLLSMGIFRVTLDEQVRLSAALEESIEKMGGREELMRRLKTGDLSLEDEEGGSIEQSFPPELLPALTRDSEEYDRSVALGLMDGPFPPGIAYATVLPLHVRYLLLATSDDEIDKKKVQEIYRASIEDLCDEDEDLLEHIIQQWLQEHDLQNTPGAQTVVDLRTRIPNGILKRVVPVLMLRTVMDEMPMVAADDEPVADSEERFLDPAYLKSHADFMHERGYTQIARRTRRLIDLVNKR